MEDISTPDDSAARVNRMFTVKPSRALLLFALLDLVFFGMGMGVPIFCILFGFAVGWYIARHVTASDLEVQDSLGRILKYSVVTSVFTLLVTAIAWGRTVSLLFDPGADLANFGIPMILFEPRASFIGWLVLMIFVSPFLQLLTTLFGSYVTFLLRLKKSG